ncbi:MAG TPA: NAD(P)H-binding protein [Bradyrhizobium sp.]|nr:NAD(P)H-binding protein [Bradyrhizobium sp.]
MTDASSHRTALLAGATGLVGGHLLRRLLADPRYRQIIAVSRKELGIEHPKLRPLITNFDAIAAAIAGLGETVDDAFCALGTTIKTAGSREAFRRVDFGHVVAFARAARVAGARRFMVVSAMGASARSVIFYLRVKGDTEEALTALGYPALHIFRPGLLLGLRAESRPWEALGMTLAPFLNSLMVGPAKAYRGIPADTVAAAMIAAAGTARTGQHIHTYADMMPPRESNDEAGAFSAPRNACAVLHRRWRAGRHGARLSSRPRRGGRRRPRKAC